VPSVCTVACGGKIVRVARVFEGDLSWKRPELTRSHSAPSAVDETRPKNERLSDDTEFWIIPFFICLTCFVNYKLLKRRIRRVVCESL
jgi:hypothetical protein